MAAETYTTQVIVLRKTKLGETDLILTLLRNDGSQLRAVAKGARKPSNTFASRLELYSQAEVLCSKGRNLDIIKEARLVESNEKLRREVEYTSAAAPMTELIDKVSQAGLEHPRLFEMTQVALTTLSKVEHEHAPSITAAHLLKTLAFVGLRPSTIVCVGCGNEVDFSQLGDLTNVSYREGGVFCGDCASSFDTILVDSETVKWTHFLLVTPFSEIAAQKIDARTAFAVLHFCQTWIHEHVGANLKSLRFMFTSGLY